MTESRMFVKRQVSCFKKLGFTPCLTEHSLKGMDLQEKEEKDKEHIGRLSRDNQKKKNVSIKPRLKTI